MPSPSPFFCRYPFTFVSKAAGEYCKPCCMYRLNEEEKKDSALKGSVEEAFTSQTFQKIREKMQNKEQIAGCHQCYKEEEAGYKSYGRIFTERTKHFTSNVLKGVDIALSRECNLACRMCNSEASTKWDNVERKLYPNQPVTQKRLSSNTKIEEIISSLETYKSVDLWKIVGGEPFINDSFYKLLEKIKDLPDKILWITTNSTFFPKPKYVKLLLKAKALHITLSVDGVEKLAEHIRVFSKWQQVDNTARKWCALASKHPSVHIYSLTTISAYNAHDLYRVFRWAADKNISWHFHFLYGPAHLQLRILPERLRKKFYSHYSQYPDFKEHLSKLKGHLLQPKQGNTRDFLNWTDKLDKIHRQSFFAANNFYTRKELLSDSL